MRRHQRVETLTDEMDYYIEQAKNTLKRHEINIPSLREHYYKTLDKLRTFLYQSGKVYRIEEILNPLEEFVLALECKMQRKDELDYHISRCAFLKREIAYTTLPNKKPSTRMTSTKKRGKN